MDKYLTPKNIDSYHEKSFWEDAFTKCKDHFEWYGKFSDFKSIFTQYMKKSSSILITGCGNSNLGEELYFSSVCYCNAQV